MTNNKEIINNLQTLKSQYQLNTTEKNTIDIAIDLINQLESIEEYTETALDIAHKTVEIEKKHTEHAVKVVDYIRSQLYNHQLDYRNKSISKFCRKLLDDIVNHYYDEYGE